MVVEMVPVKGGRWHIIPQLAVYTTDIYLYIAFWGVICYLPPFMGTRNNHWFLLPLNMWTHLDTGPLGPAARSMAGMFRCIFSLHALAAHHQTTGYSIWCETIRGSHYSFLVLLLTLPLLSYIFRIAALYGLPFFSLQKPPGTFA